MDVPAPWPYDDVLHAWWVEPGRLLAGEYPGAPDAARARAKVELLLDAGVRTVVDLTTPDDRLAPYAAELAAAAADRGVDVRRVAFPVPDLGVVEDAQYDVATAAIEEGLTRGAVYVHCWGGVGRTATVVGCVLADQGLGYDAVLSRIERLRAGTRKARRTAPEMPAQLAVIRRRAERSPRVRTRSDPPVTGTPPAVPGPVDDVVAAAADAVRRDLADARWDDALDAAVTHRTWWLGQWPEGAPHVLGLLAQDVQEAVHERDRWWPPCPEPTCELRGRHPLLVEPDLGPDPFWTCDRTGLPVAPVGHLRG